MMKLTWYVSITILKGVEVVHEFFYRDLKGLKQASVFKQPVGYLRHKKHIVRESVDSFGLFVLLLSVVSRSSLSVTDAHLTEDPSTFPIGLLHQAEDGKVPIV